MGCVIQPAFFPFYQFEGNPPSALELDHLFLSQHLLPLPGMVAGNLRLIVMIFHLSNHRSRVIRGNFVVYWMAFNSSHFSTLPPRVF